MPRPFARRHIVSIRRKAALPRDLTQPFKPIVACLCVETQVSLLPLDLGPTRTPTTRFHNAFFQSSVVMSRLSGLRRVQSLREPR